MNRETKTISASELNKYSYCPYQWYYERLYGQKELRRLVRERNEGLHLKDTTMSNFRRGELHHRREYFRYRLKQGLLKVAVAAVVLGAVYVYVRMKISV